jgi:hypothetical protein
VDILHAITHCSNSSDFDPGELCVKAFVFQIVIFEHLVCDLFNIQYFSSPVAGEFLKSPSLALLHEQLQIASISQWHMHHYWSL